MKNGKKKPVCCRRDHGKRHQHQVKKARNAATRAISSQGTTAAATLEQMTGHPRSFHGVTMNQSGTLSKWFSLDGVASLYPLLKKGDLLEYRHESTYLYSHWVVYVGVEDHEHMVIHLSVSSADYEDNIWLRAVYAAKSSYLNEGIFKYQPLRSLLQGTYHFVRINNVLDKVWPPPFTGQEIVDRAHALIRSTTMSKQYSLMGFNCEHFACLCRYDRSYSAQATQCRQKLFNAAVVALSSAIIIQEIRSWAVQVDAWTAVWTCFLTALLVFFMDVLKKVYCKHYNFTNVPATTTMQMHCLKYSILSVSCSNFEGH